MKMISSSQTRSGAKLAKIAIFAFTSALVLPAVAQPRYEIVLGSFGDYAQKISEGGKILLKGYAGLNVVWDPQTGDQVSVPIVGQDLNDECVVGHFYNGEAARWSPSEGSVPFWTNGSNNYSDIYAVNAAGLMVGYAGDAFNGTSARIFLAPFTTQAVWDSYVTNGAAYAVNAIGDVCGGVGSWSSTTSGQPRRRLVGDTARALPVAEGFPGGSAGSINESGSVAGHSRLRFSSNLSKYVPCVWDRDGRLWVPDLLPGDASGVASAIDNDGTAYGLSGPLVGGPFDPPGWYASRATIFSPSFGTIELKTRIDNLPVDFTPRAVWDINARGEVVGSGGFGSGYQIPFYLRPKPNYGVISGHVELTNYQATPSGVPITLELLVGTAVVRKFSTRLDENGDYSIATSWDGSYSVKVKAGHWLRHETAAEVSLGQSVAVADFVLLNGDVDGDNVVGLFDYLALSDAFDTASGDPGWNPLADLDGDGVVGLFDYLILSENFDREGD